MDFKRTLRSLTDAVSPMTDRYYLLVSAAISGLVLLTAPLEIWATPFARKFRLDNKHINYPMATEHVPVSLLAILSILLPLAFIVFVGVANPRVRKHAVISVLGLMMSIAATMFFADVFKLLIGNQRPDFVARCQPRSDAPLHEYVTVLDVCTNKNMAEVWEGCKSTPSGHSALSFAGLGFLALWITFSFDLLDESRPFYIKPVGFTPFLIALYVALTRIVDHKHHWIDIMFGGALGTATAHFSYRYVVRDSKPERVAAYSSV